MSTDAELQVPLTTEERFALAESVDYAIESVRDLLLVEHRSSEERHRAARTAVAVAHVIDGIESGVLNVAAPHVLEWLAGERRLNAEYATEQAQWLRDVRDRAPSAVERLSPSDVATREREISRTVEEALAQICTCDRLLAAGGRA